MVRIQISQVAEVLRTVLGLVYGGGAAVHLVLWATNRTAYAEMTPYILFEWYRELWTGLVLPNLGVLLPLLAIFEAVTAVAILSKGRVARIGLLAGTVFNLAVAPLGFWWPSNIGLAAVHVALLRVPYSKSTMDQLRGWGVPARGPQ